MALRLASRERWGTRAARLGGYLLRHPCMAPRWIADRFDSASPLERQLPWFSWPAIRFLEQWVKPHHSVLEQGSGGSTLFFARRAHQVWALENAPPWGQRLEDVLAAEAIRNVTLKIAHASLLSPAAFQASDYMVIAGQYQPDIVLIDGPERFPQCDLRPIAFAGACSQVKPGGLVILDDSWRYPGIVESAGAKAFYRFSGIGPCRLGITETAILLF